MSKYSPFSTSIRHLLQVQRCKCPLCGEAFTAPDTDDWEIDHILPRSKGGANTYANMQLVHKTCHIQKTRSERSE